MNTLLLTILSSHLPVTPAFFIFPTFMSVLLWPTKINQGHLCVQEFRAVCWNPVGSAEGTQLKTVIHPLPESFESWSQM